MSIRGRALALTGAGIFVVGVALASLPGLAFAEQKNDRKLDKTQQQDADELKAALTAAQSGQPASTDIPVTIESYHFFRTAVGDTYVAFTASVDSKILASPAVAFMFRLVNRNAAAATVPASDKRGDKNADKNAYAYEDLDFTTLKPAPATPSVAPAAAAATGTAQQAPAQPSRLSRAFHVPAGDYDLYFGLKERSTGDKKQKAKMAVIRASMSVPDFRGNDFTTSSVVLGELKALDKPLSNDQQRENPYTIGRLQITPRAGTKYATTDELSIYFQIYNEGVDASGKPNVQVDYLFFQKQGDTEKKIANSEPEILNANTLSPEFDINKHQLAGEGGWPLSRFKPGDFRLEITITDKVTGKVLTRNVNFSVS